MSLSTYESMNQITNSNFSYLGDIYNFIKNYPTTHQRPDPFSRSRPISVTERALKTSSSNQQLRQRWTSSTHSLKFD